MSDVPAGFGPHFRKSPLTDPWEPLYSRRTDQAVIIGLRVAEAHTNSRGLVHGGLISALADNAMGLSCGIGLDAAGGLVTVNLSLDFLGAARPGQWLAFETSFARRGKTLCFAQAFVTADGEPVARANATFRVLG
ncbi:MAG: PaaI family thioesterase [Pseudomonadota bacterium]